MLKSIVNLVLILGGFASLILLLPGSILLDIDPKEFDHPLPKSFTGALEPNEKLSAMEKLFEGQLFGPESLAAYKGKLITGSADGYLYEIDGNSLKPLLKLVEKSCATNPYDMSKCGRPLGLQFDSKGTLYAVEPSIGVFAIENVFTNKSKVNLVFELDQTSVLGKPSKFINDVAIHEGAGASGGHVLYITDCSVKFELYQGAYMLLGSDTGRVVKYDVNSKKVESIAENFLYPNGIEITDDRSAVLVNEFVARQVIKVYIKGPKKGQSEPLISQLPGEPDNIRRSASKKETYWLGLFSARNQMKQNDLDYFLKRPTLRKLICRLFHLSGNAIEYLGNMFGNSMLTEFGYDVKNGGPLLRSAFTDKANDYAMIMEVDINGNIVDSLHSTDKSLIHSSEVREVRLDAQRTTLFVGSFSNAYLGKLTLKR